MIGRPGIRPLPNSQERTAADSPARPALEEAVAVVTCKHQTAGGLDRESPSSTDNTAPAWPRRTRKRLDVVAGTPGDLERRISAERGDRELTGPSETGHQEPVTTPRASATIVTARVIDSSMLVPLSTSSGMTPRTAISRTHGSRARAKLDGPQRADRGGELAAPAWMTRPRAACPRRARPAAAE